MVSYFICMSLLILGVHDLMVDNKTEHLRTINILERFNIYQEVILAIIYRVTSLKVLFSIFLTFTSYMSSFVLCFSTHALHLFTKFLPHCVQERIEYVYFYINTVFGLHGMYMVSLFVATWLLSGSWIAGILANVFFIFNK